MKVKLAGGCDSERTHVPEAPSVEEFFECVADKVYSRAWSDVSSFARIDYLNLLCWQALIPITVSILAIGVLVCGALRSASITYSGPWL